jgi:hypothetical protein
MVRLHGRGVDWRKADIDPMAMYTRGEESWTVSRCSIIILCLYNVVIYYYVICVAGMAC